MEPISLALFISACLAAGLAPAALVDHLQNEKIQKLKLRLKFESKIKESLEKRNFDTEQENILLKKENLKMKEEILLLKKQVFFLEKQAEDLARELYLSKIVISDLHITASELYHRLEKSRITKEKNKIIDVIHEIGSRRLLKKSWQSWQFNFILNLLSFKDLTGQEILDLAFMIHDPVMMEELTFPFVLPSGNRINLKTMKMLYREDPEEKNEMVATCPFTSETLSDWDSLVFFEKELNVLHKKTDEKEFFYGRLDEILLDEKNIPEEIRGFQDFFDVKMISCIDFFKICGLMDFFDFCRENPNHDFNDLKKRFDDILKEKIIISKEKIPKMGFRVDVQACLVNIFSHQAKLNSEMNFFQNNAGINSDDLPLYWQKIKAIESSQNDKNAHRKCHS